MDYIAEESTLPTLAQLKERSSMVIDETYSLAAHQINEEQFVKLRAVFEDSMEILKKIETQQNQQIDDRIIVQQSLILTESHKQQLESVLATLSTQTVGIATESKTITQLYQFYHYYTCQLKSATLLQRSSKLLQSQLTQLQQIKERHSKLHEDKTMFKQMQLTKQNEEEAAILEEITNETSQQLSQLKQKTKLIDLDLDRTQIEYDKRYQEYNRNLLQDNREIVNQMLREGKLQTMCQTHAKQTTPFYHRTSKEERCDNKSFQIQVIHKTTEKWRYVCTALVVLVAVVVRFLLK